MTQLTEVTRLWNRRAFAWPSAVAGLWFLAAACSQAVPATPNAGLSPSTAVRTAQSPAVTATAAPATVAAAPASGTPGATGPRELLPFSVAVAGLSGSYADLYVAIEKDFFRQAGVDVTVDLMGATAATNVAAGRGDVVQTGVTGAFSAALNGRQTKVIYEASPGNSATGVTVATNSPIRTISDLSGMSVAVLGTGNASYGAATVYSNYIVQQGGKALNIVSVQSHPARVAQVLSGSAQATVGGLDQTSAEIEAGKLRILIDPSGSFARSLFAPDLVNLGYWGLASNLVAKREATTRFVAGLRAADVWLANHTPAEIAEVIQQHPLFKDQSPEQIQTALKYAAPFFSVTGDISADRWNRSLETFQSWGLSGIDVMAPTFSYSSIVDMSFWNDSGEVLKRITQ